MKNKFSAIVVLLFLMACGSDDNSGQTEPQAEAAKEPGMKFILKASNGNYVTIAPNFTMIANQPESGSADVFEKIDLGNGKSAIKAPNGKFVSDDRSQNSLLFANRDQNGEWETFEIINLDELSVNLKTSAGAFVSGDRSKGDTLYGNRPEAGEWEKFSLIKQ
jgi:hypothetical protein